MDQCVPEAAKTLCHFGFSLEKWEDFSPGDEDKDPSHRALLLLRTPGLGGRALGVAGMPQPQVSNRGRPRGHLQDLLWEAVDTVVRALHEVGHVASGPPALTLRQI